MRNPTKASKADRRAFPRYQVRREGRLVFAERPCTVECTIGDISGDGALVRLLVRLKLPRFALLWIEGEGTGAIHECEVRWQRGRTAGVRFIDASRRRARAAELERNFAPLRNLSVRSLPN